MKIDIGIKRVYDTPSADDGFRVLVDRLWPRGLAKAGARVDLWLREVAPSDDLRHWFGHVPEKWDEFRRRYAAELEDCNAAVSTLRQALADHRPSTLLYAARDQEHNNARALADYLMSL